MSRKKVIIIRNAAAFDFGGAERAPILISKEVESKSSVKILILSSSSKLRSFAKINNVRTLASPWLPFQNWSGLRVFLFPLYVLWQIFLIAYYFIIFIIHKPSLVHPQSRDDFIASTLAAYLLKIPVVWSDYADLKHNLKNIRIWYKNPVGKIVYICSLLTRFIIVVSKEDRRLILNETGNLRIKSKLRVVYNGSFDKKVPTRKQPVFTFVYSGRLVTDKGLNELIEAFIRFNSLHTKSQLLIIGDGPEYNSFKLKASSSKAIKFLGFKKDPFKDIKSSDVYILPTYHEGFSLSLLEACMLGMPIIATNVGGNPEIIYDGETGLLISARSSDDLFEKMITMFKNTELREKLGVNARREYEKNFKFEDIVKKYFTPIYTTGDYK